MTYAKVASEFYLGVAACAGLACLLLTSGAIVAILLYRRSRRKGPPDVA